MAPKKTAEQRARQSPIRSPEIEESSDDEENNPPLNQQGVNPTFDRVICPPTKDKSPASTSTRADDSSTSSRDDFILNKQAQQEEQLRQLFNLVNSLGSEIRSVVKVVESSSEQRVDRKSGPPQKETEKAAKRSVSFDIPEDDEDEDNEGSVESINEGDCGDDYVSHGYYRDLIAEGFDKRSPSRLALNKPAYFPIDDSVTRTLTASKYSAKAAEYSITVANAFFASVTRAALDDAIAATRDGDTKTASILLKQVSNNMAAIEDQHRDRMLFLDLTSDPNASATEKDYANNILKNDFTPGVQNKGGSAKANKVFAAYQLQFLKATQFASAKATANRHLASTSGTGTGSGTSGASSTGNQAANPSSNTQKKKKAAAERKTAAEKAAAAAAGQGKPRERRAQPEAEE
jgi:hypothetical protein